MENSKSQPSSTLKNILMLPQMLNATLESGLNYLIKHTTQSEYYLKRLENKVILFNILDLGFQAYFCFGSQGVMVLCEMNDSPDCSVTTHCSTLLSFPKKAELTQYINDRTIRLEGDIEVLQQVMALLEFVEKDPAELLSPYLGDIMAQGLVNAFATIRQQIIQYIQQSQQFFGERLMEEWQVVAPKLALVDFADQIENLQKQTALLEQKINTLLE